MLPRRTVLTLVATTLPLFLLWLLSPLSQRVQAEPGAERQVFLPVVQTEPSLVASSCALSGNYGALSIVGLPTPIDAALHPDLNLSLRGYQGTDGVEGLVDYGGGSDPNAPQLYGLFADQRTPTFQDVYKVHDWDWNCNCLGGPIANPAVTFVTLATTPGETIHLPGRTNGALGDGYMALVLYASENRVTLKYTREDTAATGYVLHLEEFCVDPQLVDLYQSLAAAGRSTLPALKEGQAFGRASGESIGVAIRDTGSFMDPRSRKDWWKGR